MATLSGVRAGVVPARTRSSRRGPVALLGVEGLIYVVAALLVVWPMATLLFEALANGPAIALRVLSSAAIRTPLINTLGASLLATLIALVVGGGVSVALDQYPVPGLRWIRLGMLLPILVPPFVTAFGWTQAYGRAGLTDRLLGFELPGLFGGFGVTLLLAVHGAPLAFLGIGAALSTRGARDLERAARASGATAARTLWTVTLPLLRPAIAAAAGLIYISSASDFGIPAVLGIPGRFPTITTEIYRALTFASAAGSFETAVSLAGLLAVLALAILLGIGRAGGGAAVTSSGSSGQPSRRLTRAGWALLAMSWTYIAIVAFFPIAALVLVALTRAYGLDPVPTNWSLVHFETALRGKAGDALARSLGLAVTAASLIGFLGIAVATIARARPWGQLLSAAVALPFAVPGSAVAIGVILAFSRWWYGTLFIILLAYVARFWSLGERPVSGALAQVGPDPFRAARACGAGALRAWVTGVWPALRPAFLAGWMLVFLTATHELTVSTLLYAPGTETIGVVVLNTETAGDVATTSAIAVLLVILVLGAALPLAGSRRLARLSGLG